MADQLIIDLIGRDRITQVFEKAALAGGKADSAIRLLTGGVLGLNQANELYNTESGRFISQTEALNAVGLRSVAQIRAEIAARQTLAKTLSAQEIPARRQLEAEIDQLNAQLNAGTSSSNQAEQALFSLGFAIDDTRQFSFGLAQGLRAVGNNVQVFLQQVQRSEGGLRGLVRAFRGPAGVIVAVNTAITLFVLLTDALKKNRNEAEKTTSAYEDLASALGPGGALKAVIDIDNALARLSGSGGRTALFRDQLQKLKDEAFPTAQRLLEIVDLLNDLKAEEGIDLFSTFFPDKSVEKAKETRNILGDLATSNRTLRSELAELSGENARRIAQLTRLNASLEEQISLRRLLLSLGLDELPEFRGLEAGLATALTDAQIAEEQRLAEGRIRALAEGNVQLRTLRSQDFADARRNVEERRRLRVAEAAELEQFNARISRLIEGAALDLITSISQALVLRDNVGREMLRILGQLAQKVGSLMFTFGVSMSAFRNFILSNPLLAAAAGAALVAAGSALVAAVRTTTAQGLGISGPRAASPGTTGVLTGFPFPESGTPGFGTLTAPLNPTQRVVVEIEGRSVIQDNHVLIMYDRARGREFDVGAGG